MKPKSLFLLTATFAIGGNSAIPAADPIGFDSAPYYYQRELIGVPTGDGLGTVILDPEIYRHSGLLHEKLRLVKKSGGSFSELPSIIEPAERTSIPEENSTSLIALNPSKIMTTTVSN